MHYRDLLKSCATTLNDRDKKYGDSDACFTRIAKIASVVLDKPISTYDVAMILACVKLGRIPGDPTYDDNYVDLANYAAFSAHFAGREAEQPVKDSKRTFTAPVVVASAESGETQAPKSYIRIKRPALINDDAFAAALNTVEEDVIHRQPASE